MGLCGDIFGKLQLGISGLSDKKATISHTCSKCGQVDEVEVAVTSGGLLNFGEAQGSGFGSTGFASLCPWFKK